MKSPLAPAATTSARRMGCGQQWLGCRSSQARTPTRRALWSEYETCPLPVLASVLEFSEVLVFSLVSDLCALMLRCREHFKEFGRHYYWRYDFDGLDKDEAEATMKKIVQEGPKMAALSQEIAQYRTSILPSSVRCCSFVLVISSSKNGVDLT